MIECELHVDSLDISGPNLVAGLSNLEGNVWDGKVQLISVETGETVASANVPSGVPCVRYSGEGKRFVLAGRDDGIIGLYLSDSLAPVRQFDGHDDCVAVVVDVVGADGKFCSGSWDGSINFWDFNSATPDLPLASLPSAHSGHINDLVFIASSSFIAASVGDDGFLRLWDRRQGSGLCAAIFDVGQAASCLHWDASAEHRFNVGTDSGALASFDLRAGSDNTLSQGSFSHTSRVRRLATFPSSGNNALLSVSDDCTVTVSRIEVGTEPAAVANRISSIKRESPQTDYITDAVCVGSEVDSAVTVYSSSTDKTICKTIFSLDL